MKRGLLILILALAAGLAAFFGMRSHKMGASHDVLLDSMPELAWIKSELNLSDEQFRKVREIHAAYRPRCEEMCHRIATTRDRVREAAAKNRGMTPELEKAIREHAETRAQCQTEMLRHIYETASTLDQDQASLYLETLLPFALGSNHAEEGSGHSP